MSIRETITVDLASVEVNDEYRVEVTLLRRVLDFTPEQARDLANELVYFADRAEHDLAEDTASTLAQLDERLAAAKTIERRIGAEEVRLRVSEREDHVSF